MEIALSDDQEFFRDTTRKFLGSECPLPKVRELRSNDGRLRARLLAPGRRAGLDVAAGARGARGRQRQRQRGVRPRPRGRRVRRATSRRARCSRATSWPPRWPARGAPSSRVRSSRRSSPVRSSPPGRTPSCRPTTGSATSALRAEADGDDFVLTGVKSPVEAGAEADQLLVTATTDAGLAQFLVAPDDAAA